MKQLVKRMLRSYYNGLGCVEAYKSKAPSDTTKTTQFEGIVQYFPEQDSLHATGDITQTTTVGGDTIRVETRTVDAGTSKETLKEEVGWAKGGVLAWLWDKAEEKANEWLDTPETDTDDDKDKKSTTEKND